jgi:hypothetical protein
MPFDGLLQSVFRKQPLRVSESCAEMQVAMRVTGCQSFVSHCHLPMRRIGHGHTDCESQWLATVRLLGHEENLIQLYLQLAQLLFKGKTLDRRFSRGRCLDIGVVVGMFGLSDIDAISVVGILGCRRDTISKMKAEVGRRRTTHSE